MIFLNDIKEQRNNIVTYMNFYSYLIKRCKKEAKEHVDNITYLFGFILTNIGLFIISLLIDLSIDKMPFILIISMLLLPISSLIIYSIFDLYSFFSKNKTYLEKSKSNHFCKNFKYLIKNHLKTNYLNYEIRKEIYFFLKNNKETDFNNFYKYIEKKYYKNA